MSTNKNRVSGLKSELFKKYQTDPMVKNPTDELNMSGNQLVVKPTVEPNIQRPRSVYDESFYKIPEYNQVAEADKVSKSNELTKNTTSLDSLSTTFQEPTKTDWRDYVRVGVGAASVGKGVYDDQESRNNFQERVRNLNDQPRYMSNEFQNMGKPGSTSMVYAKDGAMIRRGTNTGAEEAELESGEMFMLPNMDTYSVTGKSHAQGGEKFILPEGTVVFSDYLKVPGVGKTFATEAKKYNITKYQEILDNPHAKAVDRETAQIMHGRNSKKLGELFKIQQAMNGDSNGQTDQQAVARYGMKFQVGGRNRYNIDPETGVEYTEEVPPAPYEKPAVVAEVDKAKQAAEAKPTQSGVLGAQPTTQPTTATTIAQKGEGNKDEQGTVADTNAADSKSMYWKTLPNGRRIWVEGQGHNKGKSYRDQYGGNPFNLLRNRVNENYETLNPQLMSAYQFQLKDKSLAVGSSDDLVNIMEGGNNALVAMRDYHKMIGNEAGLFNPALDKGEFDNMNQQQTAQLFKEYVESPKYANDVEKGTAPKNIPWLKTQPVPIKNKEGKITGYKLEKAEMDPKFTQNYQATYKAFGTIKSNQSKDKDMLKGFRIAPEGLADHKWMGLPISPVEGWGGNTTIGQLNAFEDEEAPKLTPKAEAERIKTAAGGTYNTKLGEAPKGKYTKAPFDLAQLTPEMYGMANSNPFPYATTDYNAPYVTPQTLNIQPQLQDVDNAYMAAISAGADPNSAFLSTLNAKQKMYSEKQNFDAQQRAQVDQVNASSRWQEDIQDMQSLDKVYNYYTAQADDASTAQRQAIIDNAAKKRETYNLEEARKKLWLDNFASSYNTNGATGEMTVANKNNAYDILNINPNSFEYQNYLKEKEATKTKTKK
jgi:hypothetical protein